MRILWTIAGWMSFVTGLIGVFVPLLPTVPFMLLAAFCFARGSDRFHDWLVSHRRFGPAIRDWRDSGAISPKGKVASVTAILLAFGASVALGVRPTILIVQAVVLTAVLIFILTRPHGHADEDASQSSSNPRSS